MTDAELISWVALALVFLVLVGANILLQERLKVSRRALATLQAQAALPLAKGRSLKGEDARRIACTAVDTIEGQLRGLGLRLSSPQRWEDAIFGSLMLHTHKDI